MIEKGMKHDEIIELILEELKEDFDVYANVSGWSHYRGSSVSCKADVLLYDRVNGFLFGVEVKTFYSFNGEWMKKAFENVLERTRRRCRPKRRGFRRCPPWSSR